MMLKCIDINITAILRNGCIIAAIVLNTAIAKTPPPIEPLSEHIIACQDILTELAALNEICTVKNQNVDYIEKASKDWTIIFYIAADNDLQSFAIRNIRQIATIGSNEYMNIIVHLDIRIGNKKVTKRFYVEKNNIIEVNNNDSSTQRMDSGDPQTVISCAKWGILNFPAQHYMWVYWNHATGVIDPYSSRIIKPTDLFTFNPTTYKLDLDRSIEFFDFIRAKDEDETNTHLGICWDDSTSHYLTNQKLQYAHTIIQRDFLQGKKFDIIAFDACLMAMAEVDDLIKEFAHISISSQEVELGTGWNYQRVLAPFTTGTIDRETLARHIVAVYEQTYNPITNDYTLSAVNLDEFELLERAINLIAKLLTECLKEQHGNTNKKIIQACRNRRVCTSFDEPTYLDFHHLCINLKSQLKNFKFKNKQTGEVLIADLGTALDQAINLIEYLVIAKTAGKNLAKAYGISIYFPERRIHSSYMKTPFANHNEWSVFLTNYLLLA